MEASLHCWRSVQLCFSDFKFATRPIDVRLVSYTISMDSQMWVLLIAISFIQVGLQMCGVKLRHLLTNFLLSLAPIWWNRHSLSGSKWKFVVGLYVIISFPKF